MGPASPPPPLRLHAGPEKARRLDPDVLPTHDTSPDYARRSLLSAAHQLKTRGLDNAALWALELVSCLSNDGNKAVGPSSSRGGHCYEEQGRFEVRGDASTHHGADSSLSWPGPFAPTSTPARPSSSRQESLQESSANAYPMQSTPFLGAAGGLASHPIMISCPSSSPLPVSSPRRSGDGRSRMLGVRKSPSPSEESMGKEDASTSASGRFPPPFRQPPSPLATVSLSASTDQPTKSIEVLRPDRDESMLADGEAGGMENRGASHSAHVHFAEGGGDNSNSNVSKLDIFEASGDPAQDSGAMDDAASHLAMSYFRTGQLERCKWTLERRREELRRTQGADEDDEAKFLRGYVSMLIVERTCGAANSLHMAPTVGSTLRQSLVPLLKDLINPSDPFLLLLKGIVLRKLCKRLEAMDCFIRSVLLFPYNWTAWLELNGVIETSAGELEEILPLLPKSFMRLFFVEHHYRQAEASRDPESNALRVERLLNIFPRNAGLWISLAVGRYMQQEFDLSIEAFQQAFDLDPYRLEGLADYSNALFLLDKGDQLAHLAHTTSEWGAETAEVCCVVGNHFYYQSDHTRAIEAFKRAIRLDPTCIAAWILLGHTFLEIKNSGAAGEMYRRAIDLNPRDYRPWHGLGKVYELLDSHTFATHYYLKAAGIAPFTGTIWQSLAMTYGKLKRHREAISAYRRYLSCEQDLGAQLATMKDILLHLQALQDSRLSTSHMGEQGEEDADVGAPPPALAAPASGRASGRAAEDEADVLAWHQRAVQLLFHEYERSLHQVGDGLQEEGRLSATEAQVQADVGNLDVQTWGESVLLTAKVEAGLSATFDPLPQPSTDDGDSSYPPRESQVKAHPTRNVVLSLRYLDWLLSAADRSPEVGSDWPAWRSQAAALRELLMPYARTSGAT